MPDQPADDGKKKKGGLVKILGLVGAGLGLVGVGLGAGFFIFGNPAPTPSQEIESIIERKLMESGQLAPPAEEEVAAEGEAGAEGEGGPQLNVKEVPEVEVFVTSYYEFPGTFTTNLRNSRKFLQVGIGVSTQYDQTVISNVDSHQLSLRSEILGTIGEFTEEEIQGKAGRDALAVRIQAAINARLEVLEGFGGVETVFFTSFILQ
ncbi:MAG: flagellar basal body-associated FliL family protein [Gemmobacter sp.]|jgi:flagellar FliL protein